MHDPTSGHCSRQVRRAEQRLHAKARRQAERRRQRSRLVRQRLARIARSFEEFHAEAGRRAQPRDRLRVVYASGICAEWLGLPCADELQPILAALVRGGEETPSDDTAPERS